MKTLFHLACRFSFLFIIFLAASCKRDSYVDEENDLVYPVNFTFTNFQSTTNFLKNAASTKKHIAATGVNSNYSEGFLYYWSFNSETLTPDVKYRKSTSPVIIYNDGKPITYGNGFAFENYTAGKAANFVGPSQITIKLPIKDVISLARLGFDMTGSNTGPKDFELYYSFDEGGTFKEIALVNNFVNNSSTAKNSFTYNLSTLTISGEELWIKIVPKAGDRTGISNYSDSQGTLRIDNLHIVGIAPPEASSFSINKLHYFLFHKERSNIVIDGELDDVQQLNLELDLPVGEYDVFFILNNSNSELVFPSTILKSTDVYASNLFSNKYAEIFGYSGKLTVSGNMTSNIVLQRMYSQIKVEFTDNLNLSSVKKIVFKQEHEPFYYSPFTTTINNPILDQSSVEISDDFQVNKQLIFNQFMGLMTAVEPLNYTVEVHGQNEILRTFQLGSSIKNNVQLVFRGQLLEDPQHTVGFQIKKNENWDNGSVASF
ncbi:hypothetical protein [Sphingobacterium bovistauri]|uniref:DUF4397 domain-containing protein n=1 Tax=Sphingobacterium bovistauri TaxID=2781959 RepID=A0ABS7Z5Y9_9SPHI|nr:hypothetical protein [Sphingobacterium bovistauri]MCA5004997.1 hypothetical protein [Sphingobacterium bovistauri]